MGLTVKDASYSIISCLHATKRAHGFLPKAPIRREKLNEVIAPLWLKRFPLSDFGDSAVFNVSDDTASFVSGELACTPDDIAQKLIDIDSLFKKNAHVTDIRIIYDQLHELKGDLLTLTRNASMISIFGMINLILLGQQSPEAILDKWQVLKKHTSKIILALRTSEIAESNNRRT